MNANQKGFTLVELVVVIVILGILAATALPKFVDLSADAGNAAAQGVAGALASGSSINYAARTARGTSTGTVDVKIANVCTDAIAGTLVTGITFAAVATNTVYHMTGTGDCTTPTVAGAAGTAVSCTVASLKGTATATLICSG